MGVNQSKVKNYNNNVDFNKKLYIVIDLYLKPKSEETKNFDIDDYKTNKFIKKVVKDIIVNSLINKCNRSISISEQNILLISKTDKHNKKYLEMNIMFEFSDVIHSKPTIDIIQSPLSVYIHPNELFNNNSQDITLSIIKMSILSEFNNYVSDNYSIITADANLIISYQTLHNIDIYQK
jgi:hypothetical protein